MSLDVFDHFVARQVPLQGDAEQRTYGPIGCHPPGLIGLFEKYVNGSMSNPEPHPHGFNPVCLAAGLQIFLHFSECVAGSLNVVFFRKPKINAEVVEHAAV